jgi:hypothetical protein
MWRRCNESSHEYECPNPPPPWGFLTNGDSSGSGGSDSALILTVGGYAVATGDNTLTVGTIHSNVNDLGPVTKAVGFASFTAAADSQSGASGAVADTFADVSGADFAFIVTRPARWRHDRLPRIDGHPSIFPRRLETHRAGIPSYP